MSLRVLAVAPYVPYPGISHAGGSYLLSYMDAMAPRCHMTLFAPDDDTNRGHLSESPVSTHLVPNAPRYPLPVRKLETLLYGPSAGGHILRGFQRDRALLQTLADADIIEVHWGYLLPLVPWLRRLHPATPIAVHGHDVISQNLIRRAARTRGVLPRAARRLYADRSAAKERDYLQKADIAYYFSEKDRELLQDLGVGVPVRVLDPNLTDPTDSAAGHRDGSTVLFVGALHRPENHQGILWFVDEVWPSVTAVVPSAHLVVAGADPPHSLLQRRSDSVTVTGYVPDLASYYESASVFVAPLLSGAGLKFKVAQAMLYGIPVVTTTIGAEGFDPAEGDEAALFAVTDDPDRMADSVVTLLQDAGLRSTYGERGRAWARLRFCFSASIDAVLADYQRLLTTTTN